MEWLTDPTIWAGLLTLVPVRATAQKNLSKPDDGFADASDPSTVLLGRLSPAASRRQRHGLGGRSTRAMHHVVAWKDSCPHRYR